MLIVHNISDIIISGLLDFFQTNLYEKKDSMFIYWQLLIL